MTDQSEFLDEKTKVPREEAELLSVKQVAEITGFGVSTIWRNTAQGKFPKPMKIAGSTRWRRRTIRALIQGEAD